MEAWRSGISKRMVLWAPVVCAALGLVRPRRIDSDPQTASKQWTEPPSSPTRRLFLCIQSAPQTNHKNRVAVLHGPDWVLESSIKPACIPEREVVFATQVGEGLVPHPFTARTRLWVTKDHDVMHIRIVDSSGNNGQDMIAVSFVTNHKCLDRNSKNCSVKGGAVPVRMD